MKQYICIVFPLTVAAVRLVAGEIPGHSPQSVLDLPHLPAVALHESSPQPYLFSCEYFHFDMAGNAGGKERVSGEYTRGFPNGTVRWNNVRIAQTNKFENAYPEGDPQKYMEDFTYNPAKTNMFAPEFFAGFPNSMQTKTLVWDVAMFEAFAWAHFDKLKLNEPFEFGSGDIQLPGGKFSNRRPQLTWVGISKMNGKLCAVIDYEAFFNKLSVQMQTGEMKGRSDYWGTIWVSLSDKQIERGTLNEGVLLEMPIPGKPAPQNMTIFRKAVFERKR